MQEAKEGAEEAARVIAACYFLLNYAVYDGRIVYCLPVLLILLFSFELCLNEFAALFVAYKGDLKTCYFLLNYAWVSRHQPLESQIKALDLLFSFELCIPMKLPYGNGYGVYINLLFSFELCVNWTRVEQWLNQTATTIILAIFF